MNENQFEKSMQTIKNYIDANKGNGSGNSTTISWNNITNKPTIPDSTSDLTNDSGYITSSSIPTSLPANGGNADTVNNFRLWKGTQAEYDAITTKDANTIYMITG